MAYRCELTRRALRDAEEAYTWIARDSPRRAARWYEGLFAKIRTLADNPRRCPLAPESEADGHEIRQILYGRRRGVYRVLFVVRSEELVLVLAVWHGSRQPVPPDTLAAEADQEL
jgi:plasmid stabilization system protein ParE